MDKESECGMKHLRWVLKRCWSTLGRSEFAFQVTGTLARPNVANRVQHVCWTALRNTIPSRGCGHSTNAWDQKMRERFLLEHSSLVDIAVCWAEDYFVIAVPGSIIVWSMARNEQSSKIRYDATCLALSADGQQIVSGSVDGSVHRWDTHTGVSIGEPLCGHDSYVTCVAVSADGRLIVSG
eukprot:IDg5481t1